MSTRDLLDAKLKTVEDLFTIAKALGALRPEDYDLTFAEFAQKYRHGSDNWYDLMDAVELEGIRRTVPLPVDAMDYLTATLTEKATARDAFLSGGYTVLTGPNTDTYRAAVCIVCGRPLVKATTGRPRKTCSNACKLKASRARRKVTRNLQ